MNSKQQLMDTLTSHISLYHSRSAPPIHTNPNPRASILKWFKSLSVHQRRSCLTIVDFKFVQVLLEMDAKLRVHGRGLFIVLSDMMSDERPEIPSVCFRKSRGLLERVYGECEVGKLIYEAVRVFDSRDGEVVEKFSEFVGGSERLLDSVTVSEKLVEDVEKFVEVMDEVSGGAFLRGEESKLGEEWVEFEWLKGKGYYGIEAYVVNRLEVALRLSWMNCSSGKKRGVKLKEKVSLSGVAANVFWRKKGCLDWWGKLDFATKEKIFRTFVGKAAKLMTLEILKTTKIHMEGGMRPSMTKAKLPSSYDKAVLRQKSSYVPQGSVADFNSTLTSGFVSGTASSSVEYICRCLSILQDISALLLSCNLSSEHANEELFFSSLGSVNSTSNFVFRKLRGLLMVVSLDCTKLELFEEVNGKCSTKKCTEKSSATSRRKKGKSRNTKKVSSVRSSIDDPKLDNSSKEHTQKSLSGNAQNSGLKNKKRSNKHKNSWLSSDAKVENSRRKSKKVSADCVILEDIPGDASVKEKSTVPNPSTGKRDLSEEVDAVQGIQIENDCVPSAASCQSSTEDHQPSVTMNEVLFPRLESINSSDSIFSPVIPTSECCTIPRSEDVNARNFGHKTEAVTISAFPKEGLGVADPVEITRTQEQDESSICSHGNTVSAGFPPYEWPSVAPFHFPSVNTHLPATTDRLHLDVGHNWKNHFHQPLVQTVHQVRKSPIENGCNGILSRPMSMSLDWPPMVRNFSGLIPSMTYSYDTGFIPMRQPSFQQSFTAQSLQHSASNFDDERLYSGDSMDISDKTNSQEPADENENHWISEEDIEVHAVTGMDYSQYFGGGVMYWNPSDRTGTSFSRPPSLSSDDSSWAWREADMNTTVDDMVAFSSSFSTNGLASPSTASFCSPFDPMGPAHQALGYVIPGGDVAGKVLHSSSTMSDVAAEEIASASLSSLPSDTEAMTNESLPYPILRPIIIPSISRERSRSEFKRSQDHKSSCVPNRRDQPRIKRPPSPVVLCVSHAPHLPPPSPVSESRKHRGFPTVRSGSSSPRNWGVRGWFNDGISFEESCMRMDGSEVVWPSWRSNSLSSRQLNQPLAGTLLQDRLIAISQLARDQEHPDVAIPLQPPESLNSSSRKSSLSLMHNLLHDEIDSFHKQVIAENLVNKPYINWAVKRVTRSLQVLWPRSRTNIFGSNATGLALPTSDVDLVVCLPPVRNLEPIKEAGILEGRNGIKETCLQHAARYLANQEWVKSDSLKIVENTAIPIIMVVVEVPCDLVVTHLPISKEEQPIQVSNEHDKISSTDTDVSESSVLLERSNMNNAKGKTKSVRLDISFKSSSHTGLQTTELVKELTEQFPAATPLSMVLKQFLSDRSLDQSYSGGLSSYCLILMITRFLQHEHHHGRSINQNFGGLLMDFLYFYGNVFDPRQMRISVRGSGVYINREKGYSIDPIYIDDPLFPANNVGRNCFRIHQCVKAFADAYVILDDELTSLPSDGDTSANCPCNLLHKIIPSITILNVS
ncbi:uncharacterized protein LOC108218607 isoform X2 [Daucus carota subsp. sativus]|uniref:uncharacterized protein LOC108218607 isoform X2 n=1 Tax=Daucus carota subsp. sativus TaxID=79200 RepID=UPI0007EF1B10|nr:PREDICTED: uncharacterized protein LOC108218607 isoform X2 [Daucus carota subsp. sativus]